MEHLLERDQVSSHHVCVVCLTATDIATVWTITLTGPPGRTSKDRFICDRCMNGTAVEVRDLIKFFVDGLFVDNALLLCPNVA